MHTEYIATPFENYLHFLVADFDAQLRGNLDTQTQTYSNTIRCALAGQHKMCKQVKLT